MTDRSYGYRYSEAESLSAAEIAKKIRADIKQAVAEGLLPGKPVTYSVTSDTFSGGCSIDVRVRNWPEAWVVCDGTKVGSRRSFADGSSVATACSDAWCAAKGPHSVLGEEALAARLTLERIHGAYNHDGSDSMTDYFDVNYYGHVEFEDPESASWREADKARQEAKRRARDEAEAAGTTRIVVYGREGRRNVHDAVEVDGKLKLVCGAALWRGTLTSHTERDLTCSRCIKRAERRAS